MAEAKAFVMIPQRSKTEIIYETKELVWCKDCKYAKPSIVAWSDKYFCCNHKEVHESKWYCADGENKDEDEELMKALDADPLG